MNDEQSPVKQPEAAMQRPSMCRIVVFKPYGYPNQKATPAIIIDVNDNGSVDLFVFVSGTIELRVNQGDREGQWNWPPRV